MAPVTAAAIATAAQAAFEQARREHPGERFYVFALFSEDGDDLQPTCNTEEALARRATKLAKPALELRWFAEEFEYHQVGEDHFAPLGARPAKKGMAPAVAALKTLDRAGVFGRGAARAEVAVLILRSDQNNREVVELARQLNPRAVWPRIEAAFELAEATGAPKLLPGPGAYALNALAVTPDRSLLVAAGWFGDPELRAWKLGARPRALPMPKAKAGVWAIALSADGTLVHAATKLGIERRRVPGGAALAPLATPGITALAASPDGAWLFGSDDTHLFRWRGGEGAAEAGPALAKPLAFTVDGTALIATRADGALVLLDPATFAVRATLPLGPRPRCLATSARWLAAGAYESGSPIRLFAIAGDATRELASHGRASVCSLAFSPDGERLAAASDDGHVRVVDVASGHLLLDVRGQGEAMYAVAWVGDDRLAAAGRDTSTGPPVYLWTLPPADAGTTRRRRG